MIVKEVAFYFDVCRFDVLFLIFVGVSFLYTFHRSLSFPFLSLLNSFEFLAVWMRPAVGSFCSSAYDSSLINLPIIFQLGPSLGLALKLSSVGPYIPPVTASAIASPAIPSSLLAFLEFAPVSNPFRSQEKRDFTPLLLSLI